jgi:hypothetical protein
MWSSLGQLGRRLIAAIAKRSFRSSGVATTISVRDQYSQWPSQREIMNKKFLLIFLAFNLNNFKLLRAKNSLFAFKLPVYILLLILQSLEICRRGRPHHSPPSTPTLNNTPGPK